MKYLIIDQRMRNVEKELLKKLGYELIEIKKNYNVYEEISSHVDIFACKIQEKLIVEKSNYQYLKNSILGKKIEEGKSYVSRDYPYDIKYNVCIIGQKAIHNFKYTDLKIKEELIKRKYELINTNQGYTNCSISVIDEKSAIVTDKGLYKILSFHGIDALYIKEKLNLKLLLNNSYSNKNGFIGGAINRIGDKIIVFGDLNFIDKECKIRKFIENKGLKIIDFKGLDVIDYGGIIEI